MNGINVFKKYVRLFINKILSNNLLKRLGISFILKRIIIYGLYIIRFKFTGMKMFVKLYFTKNNIVIKNNFFKHPFFIRKNTSDRDVFEQTFLYLDFDYNLSSVKTILDLGANIGSVSRFFINKFPDAKIISVEPELSNFNQLKKNTSFCKQVFCVQKGVWSENCYLAIVDEKKENYSFSFKKSSKGDIKAISIRTIMKQHKISSIDILKIDVEGSELEIFSKNYSYWLSKTRAIFVEPHIIGGVNTEKIILKRAKEFGFTINRMGELLILTK